MVTENVEISTGEKFTPEAAVKTMLETREKWDIIVEYVVYVLRTREEEELQRQRQPQLAPNN